MLTKGAIAIMKRPPDTPDVLTKKLNLINTAKVDLILLSLNHNVVRLAESLLLEAG